MDEEEWEVEMEKIEWNDFKGVFPKEGVYLVRIGVRRKIAALRWCMIMMFVSANRPQKARCVWMWKM